MQKSGGKPMKEIENEKIEIPLEMSYLCSPCVPVYLVSTISKDGIFNLAPYGMVMPLCHKPLMYCLGTAHERDTYRNILATKEFVLNIPSADIINKINITATPFPPEINEFEDAKLTPIGSIKVSPPRVKECKAHFECEVEWMKDAGDRTLIVAKVVVLSLDKDLYMKNLAKQKGLMNPIFYEYMNFFSLGRWVGDRRTR
jgi:flavin reductase (DIM6/NTAB) family NADH-FMN oxidoreductase RutF